MNLHTQKTNIKGKEENENVIILNKKSKMTLLLKRQLFINLQQFPNAFFQVYATLFNLIIKCKVM